MIVEDLESTARGNLTHSSWMEAIGVVAVTALDKYGPITEALGKHLTPYVKQKEAISYLTTNILNGRVTYTVHGGLVSEAESISTDTWIHITINHNLGACRMVCFPYPLVQFIVGDRAPACRLLVVYLDNRSWGYGRQGVGLLHRNCGRKQETISS